MQHRYLSPVHGYMLFYFVMSSSLCPGHDRLVSVKQRCLVALKCGEGENGGGQAQTTSARTLQYHIYITSIRWDLYTLIRYSLSSASPLVQE